VLASFAAVIGLAAPAQADPGGTDSGPDATFLAALHRAGITYQNGADAVAVGKKACDLMGQGQSETDVVKSMTEQNPGFTLSDAAKFTAIAASTYCPQHLGEPPPQQEPSPPPSQGFPPDIPLPPLPAAA
jgi:hypothetical protein